MDAKKEKSLHDKLDLIIKMLREQSGVKTLDEPKQPPPKPPGSGS